MSDTLESRTSVYGTLTAVDREECSALMSLTGSGRVIPIYLLGDFMLRSFEERIGQEVGVEGECTFRQTGDGWQELSFVADTLLTYKDVGPAEAFRRLADAAAGRWAGVDADAYVLSLRGDEPQQPG